MPRAAATFSLADFVTDAMEIFEVCRTQGYGGQKHLTIDRRFVANIVGLATDAEVGVLDTGPPGPGTKQIEAVEPASHQLS